MPSRSLGMVWKAMPLAHHQIRFHWVEKSKGVSLVVKTGDLGDFALLWYQIRNLSRVIDSLGPIHKKLCSKLN